MTGPATVTGTYMADIGIDGMSISAGATALTVTQANGEYIFPPIPVDADVTITTSSGLRVNNPGAITGTLTNLVGFYVEALTRGTNNYGVYINTPTGTIAEAIHTEGGTARFNASGDASSDFIIQSDTNVNMFIIDAGLNGGVGELSIGVP